VLDAEDAAHPRHRRNERADVVEISGRDLHAIAGERTRRGVSGIANEGPDLRASTSQGAGGRATLAPRGADDQERAETTLHRGRVAPCPPPTTRGDQPNKICSRTYSSVQPTWRRRGGDDAIPARAPPRDPRTNHPERAGALQSSRLQRGVDRRRHGAR